MGTGKIIQSSHSHSLTTWFKGEYNMNRTRLVATKGDIVKTYTYNSEGDVLMDGKSTGFFNMESVSDYYNHEIKDMGWKIEEATT